MAVWKFRERGKHQKAKIFSIYRRLKKSLVEKVPPYSFFRLDNQHSLKNRAFIFADLCSRDAWIKKSLQFELCFERLAKRLAERLAKLLPFDDIQWRHSYGLPPFNWFYLAAKRVKHLRRSLFQAEFFGGKLIFWDRWESKSGAIVRPEDCLAMQLLWNWDAAGQFVFGMVGIQLLVVFFLRDVRTRLLQTT